MAASRWKEFERLLALLAGLGGIDVARRLRLGAHLLHGDRESGRGGIVRQIDGAHATTTQYAHDAVPAVEQRTRWKEFIHERHRSRPERRRVTSGLEYGRDTPPARFRPQYTS